MRNTYARVPFFFFFLTITMIGMRRLSVDSSGGRSKMRTALRQIERAVASVLLVIGAAALIGWVLVELYVKVVTAD